MADFIKADLAKIHQMSISLYQCPNEIYLFRARWASDSQRRRDMSHDPATMMFTIYAGISFTLKFLCSEEVEYHIKCLWGDLM